MARPAKKSKVKVIRKYFDTEFKKEMNPPNEFECTKDRAKVLSEAKVVEVLNLPKS